MNSLLKLLTNQFVSGGLLLMLTGSLIALLRNAPSEAWRHIKDWFIVSVTIPDRDPLFEWITLWLDNHPYTKRARRLMATTKMNHTEEWTVGAPWEPKIIFSPAKGQHFFVYQSKLIWLAREKEDKNAPEIGPATSKNDWTSFLRTGEVYTFRTPGRTQAVIRSLINDVLATTRVERENKTAIYVSRWGSWCKLFSYAARPMDSVILPAGVKDVLVGDIRAFLASREWYMKRGIPYRKGFLFQGLPGSGKTSLIEALAGELKLNLYSLNLSNRSTDDADLARLVQDIRPNSFLLLEDVDAAFTPRQENPKDATAQASPVGKADSKTGVTLSGLLNVLDGVLTPEGLIVVMTTNYPERLDSALVRPGRIDRRITFTYASHAQKIESFLWMFPERPAAEAEHFARATNGSTSMAEIQQALLEMRDQTGDLRTDAFQQWLSKAASASTTTPPVPQP